MVALCCFGITALDCTDTEPTSEPTADATSESTSDGASTTGPPVGTTSGGADETAAEPTETTSAWTVGTASGTTGDPPSLDEQLAELLAAQAVPVVPLSPPPAQDPALVALGEALFFDPILSGNMDTACASCHHPSFGSSDGLSLTLGTGAVGVGPARAEGDHPPFVARNAQALFNLGDPSV